MLAVVVGSCNRAPNLWNDASGMKVNCLTKVRQWPDTSRLAIGSPAPNNLVERHAARRSGPSTHAIPREGDREGVLSSSPPQNQKSRMPAVPAAVELPSPRDVADNNDDGSLMPAEFVITEDGRRSAQSSSTTLHDGIREFRSMLTPFAHASSCHQSIAMSSEKFVLSFCTYAFFSFHLFIYLFIYSFIPLQYSFQQGHSLLEITGMTLLLPVLDRS
jgi:hypothetical protein